jgi:hypothetical protein
MRVEIQAEGPGHQLRVVHHCVFNTLTNTLVLLMPGRKPGASAQSGASLRI